MKDLPIFATEYGAASLILREIPTQRKAYIKLQATQQPKELLEECISFCRAVGAEKIYASGHEILSRYPFHTAIVQMRCAKQELADTDAALWPLQKEQLQYFLEIYRGKINKVPNGAWLTHGDGQKLAADGGGYFVHSNGVLLGIGIVSEEELRFAASVQPGAGADVVRALAHAVGGDTVHLEVASTNDKAVSLYERLGFVKTREISRWFQVL